MAVGPWGEDVMQGGGLLEGGLGWGGGCFKGCGAFGDWLLLLRPNRSGWEQPSALASAGTAARSIIGHAREGGREG